MRIIGGSMRGRPLKAPEGADIRPTADRTRESLFNLLEHGRVARGGAVVAGAVALDAFAGAGAFGLEAISRGAEHVYALDNAAVAVAAINGNAKTLGVDDRLTATKANVLSPPPAAAAATLVFLDPPYGKALGAPALQALADRGWIADGAVVALETGAKEDFESPVGFTLFDDRRYGRARVRLMTYSAA